jgi:magnesium transporter
VSRHYALDLQEVEDLLETYFTHIDSTFAELQALDEFIDDTEDFVNIELDSQRNQLIKLELILTTGTLFVSIYGVVAGVFGMNLRNGAEDSKHTFVLVNIICGVGTIVSFILAVFFIRFKRIM